jgi:hypothetical protein
MIDKASCSIVRPLGHSSLEGQLFAGGLESVVGRDTTAIPTAYRDEYGPISSWRREMAEPFPK